MIEVKSSIDKMFLTLLYFWGTPLPFLSERHIMVSEFEHFQLFMKKKKALLYYSSEV